MSYREYVIENRGPKKLRWCYHSKGTLKLKETYGILVGFKEFPNQNEWKNIWGASLYPKVVTFLWKIVRRRILMGENLKKRVFLGMNLCSLCAGKEEAMDHLLDNCIFSSNLWDKWA